MKKHLYKTKIVWTGNLGVGTEHYTAYQRDLEIHISGKEKILGSSDPAFLGDEKRHNPEDLFLSSISSCHALWYLHLCSSAKIIVKSYIDYATGEMEEDKSGSGSFQKVILCPEVIIAKVENIDKAMLLHHEANKMCFIANSLNFKIEHRPHISIS